MITYYTEAACRTISIATTGKNALLYDNNICRYAKTACRRICMMQQQY